MNYRIVVGSKRTFTLLLVFLCVRAFGEDNQFLIVNGTSTNFEAYPFVIGDSGTNNYLIVTNGGSVTAGIWIGNAESAALNGMLITGTNSTFEGSLRIGNNGSRNELRISDGAWVHNNQAVIGELELSSNNVAIVEGSNSIWTVDAILDIGRGGSSNRLQIASGGRVNAFGMMGGNTGNNNLIEITGLGSVWNGGILLGLGGASNNLVISEGGQITNGYITVGADSSSSSNFVLVTGRDSKLDLDFVKIGDYGSQSNLLVVESGATIDCRDAYIGKNGTQNTMIISGTNSSCTARDELFVGYQTSDSSLKIFDGGRLAANDIYITGGSNNVVEVSSGILVASNFFHIGIGPLKINQGSEVRSYQIVELNGATNDNSVQLGGGRLIVTNSSSSASVRILSGTLTLNGGDIIADELMATTGGGQINFYQGNISAKKIMINNGNPFVVGDGIHSATLQLEGDNFSFANGLVISSNAVLRGYGTILNDVTNYGTIIADQPNEKMVFSALLSNNGQIVATNGGGFFEIIQLAKAGGSTQLSVEGIGGLVFSLEYKDSFFDPSWKPVLPSIPGTNGTMILTDPDAMGQMRVYRVRAK